ncbi:hypothetical protein, partial [Streptomyces albidoflavus]|uniref:hypothetical protein n=1 Tax=Streptomyces albidoflavus TaxID=1886 RepID=UPI0027BAC415
MITGVNLRMPARRTALPALLLIATALLAVPASPALASNGELGPTEIGRYKSEYIDPIAELLADPAYADLRIVAL